MTFQLHKLILIFVRLTSFIVLVPGYSYKGIPSIMKVAIVGILSVFIYPALPDLLIQQSMFDFGLLIIKEALFGMALGFVAQLLFSSIEIAGNLTDFQVGFSMGAVYDPAMGAQASNYGRTYYWIAIAVFFMLDMHLILMDTILNSFKVIPLGTANIYSTGFGAILRVFSEVFVLGISLAIPMIITALVTDVVLGVVSRTVPQINVFMLGMPMKSMISFFIFIISIGWIINSSGSVIRSIPEYINGFINLYRP